MMYLVLFMLWVAIRSSGPDEKLKKSIENAMKEDVSKKLHDIVTKTTEDIKEKLEDEIERLIHWEERDDKMGSTQEAQGPEEEKEESFVTSALKKTCGGLVIVVILILIMYLVRKIIKYCRKLKSCYE
ncbi:hypothetical protein [Encephalitozoon cuniculi GB-M1]|uniref:Uncharacterized protein n=2 Tax=Encephalitozoon cuniculi TaxID=6035 RepID=Q8SUJ0_ENCCU|nr:uncharacterized protein ECU08_1890 [Encephalitozoon cuniculi GB-M1]AGE95179.1 hypothetical protein ECU08_1890 [Encephalitozoon cuniculi]KMV65713.1 hypothetical protein M970_081890 [Encephalitozoon cuniculi EcunIII-L]CAD26492.1 hypothetical protein [Encephalitozoon cuniculi GB-M1]